MKKSELGSKCQSGLLANPPEALQTNRFRKAGSSNPHPGMLAKRQIRPIPPDLPQSGRAGLGQAAAAFPGGPEKSTVYRAGRRAMIGVRELNLAISLPPRSTGREATLRLRGFDLDLPGPAAVCAGARHAAPRWSRADRVGTGRHCGRRRRLADDVARRHTVDDRAGSARFAQAGRRTVSAIYPRRTGQTIDL